MHVRLNWFRASRGEGYLSGCDGYNSGSQLRPQFAERTQVNVIGAWLLCRLFAYLIPHVVNGSDCAVIANHVQGYETDFPFAMEHLAGIHATFLRSTSPPVAHVRTKLHVREFPDTSFHLIVRHPQARHASLMPSIENVINVAQ